MNIVLIGYRGTGKTFIGRALAKKLGREFVDTDDLIVERAGRGIPRIFEENGEAGFRKIEAAVVAEAGAMDNLVIACGGGVPMDKGNVESLKKKGVIILLEASVEKIFKRINADKNRPALTDRDAMGEIRHLLEKRKPFYDGASEHRISTEEFRVGENVEQIIVYLKEKGVLT